MNKEKVFDILFTSLKEQGSESHDAHRLAVALTDQLIKDSGFVENGMRIRQATKALKSLSIAWGLED